MGTTNILTPVVQQETENNSSFFWLLQTVEEKDKHSFSYDILLR